MLEIKGITKIYDTGEFKQTALDNVSINFRQAEFASILGPSGSGKTTLLNIIGGLDHYTSGDIKINEVSTKKFKDKDWDSYRNHRIGFVFQNYHLIPHQSVLQNVKLALTLSGVSKKSATKRAIEALKTVGLSDHIHKLPNQLSGGQMQRVAIARALINNPEIILADEPTGALDSETSLQIMQILKQISATKLVIMVTHNPQLAQAYSTRIIGLKDGKIIADSTPYDAATDTSPMNTADKHKRTKMRFRTALTLSLSNLLTKKGRTLLVAFAGSIGIIGIALILSLSTGFKRYIDYTQETTLSSYPLKILQKNADIASALLNTIVNNNAAEAEPGTLVEIQTVTETLTDIGTNDLRSFKKYCEEHKDELSEAVLHADYNYSVDPIIYSKTAEGELKKVNPNVVFQAVTGSPNVLSAYTSLTSIYRQHSNEALAKDYNIIAGRLPQNYNELVISLANDHQISELLVYGLGIRDIDEITTIIGSILSGQIIEEQSEPYTFTYDDLLSHDLRLIYPSEIYHYNEKYDIYEDMSSNAAYMQGAYENAERLKIVGIVVPKTESILATSGILYTPDLITHIIEKSADTEAVQKQLLNPDTNVISGQKFDTENASGFNFNFNDLVTVNNQVVQSLIGNIDQNAINREVTNYMSSIANEITTDVTPAKNEYIRTFENLAWGLQASLPGRYVDNQTASLVSNYLNTTDTHELLKPSYKLLLQTVLKSNLITGDYAGAVTAVKNSSAFNEAAEAAGTAITRARVQQAVLAKVGGLTQYLSSTFASASYVDPDRLSSAFTLNVSEEELVSVVTTMFTKEKASLASSLSTLGYQDLNEPTSISVFFNSFDGKKEFINFIEEYNEKVTNAGEEDKTIQYTDLTGLLTDSIRIIIDAVSYILIAFVSISLVVSSIMIGIITYISVYERKKEIGILRAIGASKRNISNIFNAETFIVGLLSGLIGIGISYALIPIINLVLHHYLGNVPLNVQLDFLSAAILVGISIALTLIGGLLPAHSAAKKDPVEALRSE